MPVIRANPEHARKDEQAFIWLVALTLFAVVTAFAVAYLWDRAPLEGIHDNDKRMADIAKSSGPIIDQAMRFLEKQHRLPSGDELQALVNDPRLAEYSPSQLGASVLAPGFAGKSSWNYATYPTSPTEFWLSYRFSDSQALKYHYDGVKSAWLYFNDSTETETPILVQAP